MVVINHPQLGLDIRGHNGNSCAHTFKPEQEANSLQKKKKKKNMILTSRESSQSSLINGAHEILTCI